MDIFLQYCYLYDMISRIKDPLYVSGRHLSKNQRLKKSHKNLKRRYFKIKLLLRSSCILIKWYQFIVPWYEKKMKLAQCATYS